MPPVPFLPGSRGMRRGEIWWAKLDPPAGRRPVVLLSRNEAYTARSLIIVAPVTTRIRHITSEVLLDTEDGLPQKCAANLDIMTTVPKDCLQQRITALSPKKIMELETAIHFALGIE